MLQIPCPWCGVRDEDEFHYGGELPITRPDPDANDRQWADYLFNRKNIKGLSLERWCHDFGCNQWFKLVRNTATHEILTSCRLQEDPRETGS